MKKILLLILVALMALPALNAQFSGVGGGLAFSSGYHFHDINFVGNKSGNLALSLKGIYKISVPIEVSPSFTFFYPHVWKDVNEKEIITTMMLDVNGHYIFNSLDKFEFYGLAGFDILLARNKIKYIDSTSPSPESDNALGLNVGVGSYMKLTNQFDFYLEAKYILSKYHQFMLNTGILINIDWLKKHEDAGIN